MLENFKSVSDHFWTFCIKGLRCLIIKQIVLDPAGYLLKETTETMLFYFSKERFIQFQKCFRNFFKKETQVQVFSSEICEIFQEYLRTTTSVNRLTRNFNKFYFY